MAFNVTWEMTVNGCPDCGSFYGFPSYIPSYNRSCPMCAESKLSRLRDRIYELECQSKGLKSAVSRYKNKMKG